jgi:hypothetical protein
MRRSVRAAVVAGLCVFHGFAIGGASAEIVLNINKSKQRMAVVVDGAQRHIWTVSTGLGGGPPSGTYRPERMARKWFSRKYNMSPMPHSIFFHEGYAIHGTVYVSRLGQRASHGCVRLHPANASALFDLVRSHGMGSTTIIISNSDYVAKPALNLTLRSSLPASDGPPQPSSVLEADLAPEDTGSLPPAPAALTGPTAPSGEE